MFREIKEFKIFPNQIYIETIDGRIVNEEFIHDFNALPCGKYTSIFGVEFTISEKFLSFKHGFDDREYNILFNTEIKHNVKKSFKLGMPFDLNYRKHLRSKYSKKNFDVVYTTNNFDPNIVAEIEEKGQLFSTGVENKPVVVIYTTTGNDTCFLIIKNEKIVFSTNEFDLEEVRENAFNGGESNV